MNLKTELKPRCWLEIDLAALERNVGRIRAFLPAGMLYVAAIKADAYGCGLPQVGRHLLQCGVQAFGVANVAEGVALRELGAKSLILVMGPLVPEEDPFLWEYGLTPTLSCVEEVQRFNDRALALGRPIQAHVKVDTGMGRTGFWHESMAPLYAALEAAKGLSVQGLYTHLATAGQDLDYVRLQRRRLLDVFAHKALGPSLSWLHADSSGSIELSSPQEPFNAVRIGLLQYGVVPGGMYAPKIAVEPIFHFCARIGLIKTLPAGASIGYGRTHVLKRESRTAVITLGYADGLPTTRQNCGHVLIHGLACPILGRVSMDQTVVDVTDCPQAACGDTVVLIGSQGDAAISLETYSQWCGRIPWESLTNISKRVLRMYRLARG